jgi:GntR family transcriptional regulator, transcriptional repressor for pyruvate dehydrogenase complex
MDNETLTPKPPSSLDSMVSNVIRRIHEGKFRPSDQLPSENEFAKEFNVARGSVREAFKALEALGILETSAGKRAKVGRLNGEVMSLMVNNAVETMQVSVQQTLDLRRTLEIRTARIAALRRSEQSLGKIVNAAKRMRLHRGDSVSQTAADIDFHIAIAEATGNPLYTVMIESFRIVMEKTCPVGWNSRSSEAQRDAIFDMHDAIAEAIRQQDANAAEQAMALHFDNSVQFLIAAGIS